VLLSALTICSDAFVNVFLVDLTAVEVISSVLDIRSNNYEECIDLDSLESVTLDWVYRVAKEGKTMINRIDLQEFLVILEGTLDGVKRYFVYIAKGLEPP
jgi:DNA primase